MLVELLNGSAFGLTLWDRDSDGNSENCMVWEKDRDTNTWYTGKKLTPQCLLVCDQDLLAIICVYT